LFTDFSEVSITIALFRSRLRTPIMRAIPITCALIFLAAASVAIQAGSAASAEQLDSALARCLTKGNSPAFCKVQYMNQARAGISTDADSEANAPANPVNAKVTGAAGLGGLGSLLVIRFIIRRALSSWMKLALIPLRRSREQADRTEAEASSFAGKLRTAAADDDHNQAIDAMIAVAITSRSAPTPPPATASNATPVLNVANQQPRTFGRRVAAG
jgi:hypothetical protein